MEKKWKRSLVISCLKKTLERENGVQISDKTPKNAENTTMRTLQSRQKRKKHKQIPKWQLLNQMTKMLLLQTAQLQIMICHFLAKKHSIIDLQGLIYFAEKSRQKNWSYPKAFDNLQIKKKLKRKLRRTL